MAQVNAKSRKSLRRRTARKLGQDDPALHLAAFIDFVDETYSLLRIATRGISGVRGMPTLIATLINLEHGENVPEEQRKKLENAKDLAALAEREVKNDFPLLYAHLLVAVWSALEVAVPKLAAGWLLRRPDILKKPEFEKIKIPVGIYEQLAPEGRMSIVVEELLQAQRTGQTAIFRFEALLSTIGLKGNLNKKLRRDLIEVSHVRNLIIHRLGVADSRFVEACPWLRLKEGSSLKIGRKRFDKYVATLVRYGTEIAWRMVVAKGGKRPRGKKRPQPQTSVSIAGLA